MDKALETERLALSALAVSDAGFIRELVNTAEWIRYIGERNIRSIEDAENYISRLTGNGDAYIWVVRQKGNAIPAGIITLLKKEYLDHHDIGFAFLPPFFGIGFAFEASKAVMAYAMDVLGRETIVAVTLKENLRSARLLGKLGLKYSQTIFNDNEELLLYTTAAI